jgi:hypothetical protein
MGRFSWCQEVIRRSLFEINVRRKIVYKYDHSGSIQFQLVILEFLYPFCFGKAHHMYDKHSVTMHAGMCVERSLIKDGVTLS